MKKVFIAIMALAAIALVGCKDKDEPEIGGADIDCSLPADVEAVDLGLPSGTKWANMNVGATKPEEYGAYFAWGETKPKLWYTWLSYFDTYDDGMTFNKYYNNGGKTILDPKDDAAVVNWGGDWRMPTRAEQEELLKECTWTWTESNDTGIKGFVVTSKTNGNFIFLPAAGYYEGTTLKDADNFCVYLSTALSEKYSSCVVALSFYPNDVRIILRGERRFGQSIRAVCK